MGGSRGNRKRTIACVMHTLENEKHSECLGEGPEGGGRTGAGGTGPGRAVGSAASRNQGVFSPHYILE